MTSQYDSLDTPISTQLAGEYALSFDDVLSVIAERAREEGLPILYALLSAETAIQSLNFTEAAKWITALQDSHYQTLRLALWHQRFTPMAPVSAASSLKSDLWLRATPQTQGGWALEQAGAWLKADDSLPISN